NRPPRRRARHSTWRSAPTPGVTISWRSSRPCRRRSAHTRTWSTERRDSTSPTFPPHTPPASRRARRATTTPCARRSRPSRTPPRSSSSVRARSLDRDAVLADLRVVAATHGAAYREIAEIRLFGSLARGTANPYADADLLGVLDATDFPFRDRLPRYKPMGSPVPLDMTVCTREE